MTTEKTKPICKECKSDSVEATAVVEWDVERQEFIWLRPTHLIRQNGVVFWFGGEPRELWNCASDQCQGDASDIEWVNA